MLFKKNRIATLPKKGIRDDADWRVNHNARKSELPNFSEWQLDFIFRKGSRMSNSSGENNQNFHSVVPGLEKLLGVLIASPYIAVLYWSLCNREFSPPKARCQQCELTNKLWGKVVLHMFLKHLHVICLSKISVITVPEMYFTGLLPTIESP